METIVAENAVPNPSNAWQVLGWCLPALLGFAAFLVAFPIDRRIPFWHHLSLAETFGAWFLFVVPPATTVAIAIFRKCTKAGNIASTSKWFLLATLVLAILLNLVILLGLYAAANF